MIPDCLAGLGEVFFSIPPREKSARRPRTGETLLSSGDPVLEAYHDAGHNYGIACRGDLAVLDEDKPDVLKDAVDYLPETAWQPTGSETSSNHRLLRVPGLDEDIPLEHPKTGENVGHVKGAQQSYVVGPGSLHPDGGRYGPLHGDTIAAIEESDLSGIWRNRTPRTPTGGSSSSTRTRKLATGTGTPRWTAPRSIPRRSTRRPL